MTSFELRRQESILNYTGKDGIDMGVLKDGTPYLGATGLALLCGTTVSNITTLIKDWDSQKEKPRGKIIKRLIEQQGGVTSGLYIPILINGTYHHAISDVNCMAILEYYAFEAQTSSEQARNNYRALAKQSLREYIYKRTGYAQSVDGVPSYWQTFHERLTLNELPAGYFSVFTEIANLLVTSIRRGMPFDSKTMPDISVGQAWAIEWKNKNYEQKFGSRTKFLHRFPPDFPQKDPEAWIYPIEALGVFRKWLDGSYLRTKFPKYLASKARRGQLQSLDVESLIEAVQPIRIGNDSFKQ